MSHILRHLVPATRRPPGAQASTLPDDRRKHRRRRQGVDLAVSAILGWSGVSQLHATDGEPPAYTHVQAATSLELGLLVAVFALILHALRNLHQQRVRLRAKLAQPPGGELADIMQAIGSGVLTINLQQRITHMNGIAEELTGWSALDAKFRTIDEVYHPIHEFTRESALAEIHRALESDMIGTVSTSVILADRTGTEHRIHQHAAPIRDHDGRITGIALVFRSITVEHQLAKELRASEAYNRSIVNSSPDCLKVLSLDGRLVYMAPHGCRIMEVDDFCSVENADWLSFWQGNDRKSAQAAVTAAASGGFGRFRGFCPTAKGSPRWWDVAITPILNEQGEPEKLLAVSRDVTADRESQNELRTAKEQLDLALEAARACTWDSDLVANRITLDAGWAKMLGQTPQRTVTTIRALMSETHPDDQPTVIATVRETVNGVTDDYVLEQRIKNAAGDWIWLLSQGRVMARDEHGKAIRIRGTNTDITDRKKIQENLNQFITTLDHTQDCVFIFTPDTLRFSYANQGAIKQVGFTSEELLQMTPLDIKPDFTEARFRQIIAPLIAGTQPSVTFETRHQHKSGKVVPVEILLQYVAPTGEPARFVAVVRDITERKRAENEIRELNENLELRVAERTAEIEQALTTLDFTADATLVTDAETLKFVYANQGAVQQLGYSREELLTMSALDINSEYDSSSMGALLAPLVRGEQKILKVTSRHRRRNGHEFPVEINLQLAVMEDGTRRFIAVARDISERVRSESAMRQALAALDATADAALVSVPGTGKYSYVNQGAVNQLGYTREELLEMSPLDINPELDESRLQNIFGNLEQDEREVISLTTRHRHKDGHTFPVEINVQMVKFEDGRHCFVAVARDISERIKSEGEMRQALAALNATADAVLLSNPFGTGSINFSYVNQGAEQQLGYSRDELLEMSPLNINQGISESGLWELYKTFQRGELEILNFTASHRHEDGHEIPVEVNLQMVNLEDGQTRFIAISRDVTERHQVEQALIENEARLRFFNELGEATRALTDPKAIMATVAQRLGEFLGASRCAYAEVQPDGDTFTVDNDFTRDCPSMAGTYQLSTFGERTVNELLAGKTLVIRDAHAEIPANGGVKTFDAINTRAAISCSLINRDGLRALMAVHQTTPRDWTPSEVTLVQEVIDRCWATIERARVQQALAVSERFVRASLDALSSQIAVLNTDGKIVATNRAWNALHESSNPSLAEIGETANLLDYCDRAATAGNTDALLVAQLIREVITGQRSNAHYEYASRPVGHEHWFLCRITRFSGDGPVRVAVALEDITAIKQAEEAVRNLNADLEARVEQRTAELSAANQKLDQASRLKDEFLANMSHELRTPLNAILGLSEALLEQGVGEFSERQIKSITTISSSGTHLLALINDILDLSKIEAGKLELIPDQIDLPSFCESCMLFVRTQAMHKQINVSFDGHDIEGAFYADPKRLKQVLVNLLTNAVKFTPEGGNIGLRVESSPSAQRVKFTVWDDGIGITASDQSKLFRAFTQLDSGLARAQEGTGLGLAMVAKLVELHGGSVSLESTVDQGSRFTVVLPVGVAPEAEEPMSAPACLPASGPSRAMDSSVAPRILLAEDNEANIQTLGEYLEYQGFSMHYARNGMLAVEAAQELQPDLILMDIQMPVMDGLTAIKKIKAHEDIKNIPIIALTALAMPNDRERCLMAGAEDYLSKPVSLRALMVLIDKMLPATASPAESGEERP
ncbi:PAS domain S-box protein [Synoicihabitans lomoniglobus]|uniref:histidine kinase n=1 Tax=Synoicihabitans lomoniglobus TaxID=2909285 RepID=A0AAF0I3E6_9BACT|nr:PAS domain S-box protein [Opitutaceae bacterium LMO-M01]WED65865.1 PAS domain S-box protein [Opitutaceae bacterium LMO-M01]